MILREKDKIQNGKWMLVKCLYEMYHN